MNIRLHNKVEVICGDKTYTAYNTMLRTVFDKLKNLENYNGYFAFGTGQTEPTVNDTHLGNWVASYSNATTAYNADVSQTTVYVERSTTLNEDDAEGLAFCEIGITDSSAQNPVIYNRILFKDSSGNVQTITKISGEKMIIKLTIYADIAQSAKSLFTQGQNILIRQILGDNVLTSNSFTIKKNTGDTAYDYDTMKYILSNNNGAVMEFTTDFGTGEFANAILCLDNTSVLSFPLPTGLDFTGNIEGKFTIRISGN